MKPPGAKARALYEKLKALAERGIDGERASAQRKLARLIAQYDFNSPSPVETPDLFLGSFKKATTARRIYAFAPNEFDVANSVKWAIESVTKISCIYRDGQLMAEATASTANKLTQIATHIANSFRVLLEQFGRLNGVSSADKSVFVRGLYDGMMNEVRSAGERLPGQPIGKKKVKIKKSAQSAGPSLHVHPYTVAVSLGRQIRFSAPLEQIKAELDAVTRGHLSQPGETLPNHSP